MDAILCMEHQIFFVQVRRKKMSITEKTVGKQEISSALFELSLYLIDTYIPTFFLYYQPFVAEFITGDDEFVEQFEAFAKEHCSVFEDTEENKLE